MYGRNNAFFVFTSILPFLSTARFSYYDSIDDLMPAASEQTEYTFLCLFWLRLGIISCYKHTFPYAVRQRHFFRPKKIALHRQPNNILVELNFIRPKQQRKKCMYTNSFGWQIFLSLFCFAFISKKNDAKPANGLKKKVITRILFITVCLCACTSTKERLICDCPA